MNEKEVNSFIDGLINFLGIVFGAIEAAVSAIPQTVLGFIFIGLLVLWLFRKARHG